VARKSEKVFFDEYDPEPLSLKPSRVNTPPEQVEKELIPIMDQVIDTKNPLLIPGPPGQSRYNANWARNIRVNSAILAAELDPDNFPYGEYFNLEPILTEKGLVLFYNPDREPDLLDHVIRSIYAKRKYTIEAHDEESTRRIYYRLNSILRRLAKKYGRTTMWDKVKLEKDLTSFAVTLTPRTALSVVEIEQEDIARLVALKRSGQKG
jgi:hypothetical protein